MGIERSKAKIEQSKIVLCLADASSQSSIDEVQNWVNELKNLYPTKRIAMIINKSDLHKVELGADQLSISAKHGDNLEALNKWLVQTVTGDFDMANETIITNARHRDALLKTAEALETAKNGLETGITGDFIAMDIRQAMHWLGTITGDISEDDLLENIFKNFCIGK